MKNACCVSIVILNIVDCAATAIAINHQVEEDNPLAAWFIEHLGGWACIPKIALAMYVAFMLWKYWYESKWWRFSAMLVCCVYTLITVYHVYGLYHILF